jgi:hypothetical protein
VAAGSVRGYGDPNANYAFLINRGWLVAGLSEGRAGDQRA